MASSPETAAVRTLDVSQFMQGLKFNRYHLQILILCSLVTFFDGQDFTALSYALPYIREDMGLTDEMTGYVSSAAFLGQMIGSLFGAYLGDAEHASAQLVARVRRALSLASAHRMLSHH